LLVRKAGKIYVLVQNKDLEDELSRALQINKRRLCEMFHSKGISEFKSNFIETKDLISKLERHSIDYRLLWNNNNDFKSLIELQNNKPVKYYTGKELIKISKR
jgi:hypothetical protein